jgi:hypothetical protein
VSRVLAILVTFSSALGVAHAVPARLPYMPQDPPKAPVISVLAGTVWRGMLFMDNSRIEFKSDGTLTYGEPGSTSPGSWRLEGGKLLFEINKYSEYDTVWQGDVIQGIGWNKAGERCKPLLRREGSSAPLR